MTRWYRLRFGRQVPECRRRRSADRSFRTTFEQLEDRLCLSLFGFNLVGGMNAVATGGEVGVGSFVQVDPTSGAKAYVADLAGVDSVRLGSTALDIQNQRYYFEGSTDLGEGLRERRLYLVDTRTGHVLANPLSPGIGFNECDPDSKTFFGFQLVGGALMVGTGIEIGVGALVQVDPIARVMAQVATVPDLQAVRLGSAAMDTVNDRYFFEGSVHLGEGQYASRLIGVDVRTGQVVVNRASPGVGFYEFDPGTETLLGFNLTGGMNLSGTGVDVNVGSLVRVNPTTGAKTLVRSFSGLDSVRLGSSTFDAGRQLYYFEGAINLGDGQIERHVYSVDTQTGQLKSNISSPGAGFFEAFSAAGVEILSATTLDSHSVTFEYQVGAGGMAEFEVGVYRSADNRFQPDQDRLVGDLIRITDTASGLHSYRTPCDLPPDTSRPYVLVVANPTDEIALADDAQSYAFFRKHLLGVVTHGYQGKADFPSWVPDMAGALRAKGYDATIAFDWSLRSALPAVKQTEYAGLELGLEIYHKVNGLLLAPDDVVDLHLIGHSRGSVVIGQAVEYLQRNWDSLPPSLQHGYIQMTMLDPHPARNLNDAVVCSVADNVYGWLAYAGVYWAQEAMRDPDASVPDMVDYADVFYQKTDHRDTPTVEEQILNLWGEVVSDANNVPWTRIGTGHGEVPPRYRNEIVTGMAAGVPLSLQGSGTPSAELDFLYPEFVDDRQLAETIVSFLETAMAAYQREDAAAASAALEAVLQVIEINREQHIDPEMADFLASSAGSIVRGIATDLGPIGFRCVEDLDLSLGIVQYRFETTRQGTLTAETSLLGSQDSLMLQLFDAQRQLLATSTLEAGAHRIDWEVDAGQTFIVEVSGVGSGVDLRLANLVDRDGTRLTVYGTAAEDVFEFDASASRVVTINGIRYAYDADQVAAVGFDAADGFDVVTLRDSPGDETLTVEPGMATFLNTAGTFSLVAAGFEELHAYAAAGGYDTAALLDSPGNDKFKGDPTVAKMYKGGTFFHRVKFFDAVEGLATSGHDYARLWDSSGDDRLESQRDATRLYGEAFDVSVSGFPEVCARASNGGFDRADLIDSPLDDTVRARAHKVMMWAGDYADPLYKLTARTFDDVYLYATEGGFDKAKLHDTVRDDLLLATGDWVRLSTQKDEVDMLYQAIAFEWVKAYGTEGHDIVEKVAVADWLQLELAGPWVE